ncbi:MAG: hypothetical protein PHC51_08155 [bacterium]|nr:hypothetical protein [bacterium]
MFEMLLFTLIACPFALYAAVNEKGHNEKMIGRICLTIIVLIGLLDIFLYGHSEIIWAGLVGYGLVIHSSGHIKGYFVVSLFALWMVSGTITSALNGISEEAFTEFRSNTITIFGVTSFSTWIIGSRIFPGSLQTIKNKFFSVILCLFWFVFCLLSATLLPKESVELAFFMSRFSLIIGTLLITVLIYRATRTAVRYTVLDQTVVSHLEAALIVLDDINKRNRSVEQHSLGNTENIGRDATQRLIDGLVDHVENGRDQMLKKAKKIVNDCQLLLQTLTNDSKNIEAFANLQERLIALMKQTVNPLLTSNDMLVLGESFYSLIQKWQTIVGDLYQDLLKWHEEVSNMVISDNSLDTQQFIDDGTAIVDRIDLLLAGKQLRQFLYPGQETVIDMTLESMRKSITKDIDAIKGGQNLQA